MSYSSVVDIHHKCHVFPFIITVPEHLLDRLQLRCVNVFSTSGKRKWYGD